MTARTPGRPGRRAPGRRHVPDAEAELADAVDGLFPAERDTRGAPREPYAAGARDAEDAHGARDAKGTPAAPHTPGRAPAARPGGLRPRPRRRPLVPGPARDVLGGGAERADGDPPAPRRRTTVLPLTDPRWAHRDPVGRVVSAVTGVGALWAAGRLGHGRRDRLLWACALAPDLALVVGVRAAPRYVRMPGYAIRPYNVLHSPLIPAGLLTAAGLGGGRRVAVAGLAWLGHIALDRAQGYGPRDPDGYIS